MNICSVTCADNLNEAKIMARTVKYNRPYGGFWLGDTSNVRLFKTGPDPFLGRYGVQSENGNEGS